MDGLGAFLLPPDEAKAATTDAKVEGQIDDGIRAISEVMSRPSESWIAVRDYAREMRLLVPEDERVLIPVLTSPPKVPTGRQAERLIHLLKRCVVSGFDSS